MKIPVRLFIIGLVVHILYNLVLVFTDSRLSSFLQPDTGQLTEVITTHFPDSRSYIDPADNLIKYGVLGKGTEVDYNRTIGYPLVICFFKILLGQYWFYGLALLQTCVGALIYPLTFLIGRLLFPDKEKLLFASTIILMALGGYFTKSLYVMTDLLFSVLFLLGVYLSMLSVTARKKKKLMIMGIIALSLAGLVRPALLLYPFAQVLLLIYVSKAFNTWSIKGMKRFIWLSSIVLIISCNYSAFRIHHYYGSFAPTDVLGINMFDYSTKNILISKNKNEELAIMNNSIKKENNWLVKDKLRRAYFFETIKKYPVAALSYWIKGVKSHLLSTHLMDVGSAYGYYKEDIDTDTSYLRKSTAMIVIFYTFYIFNILIVLSFILFLFQEFFMQKHFLFSMAILSVVLSIVGPSFIAATGARMRIPIEPFIVMIAILYLTSKWFVLKRIQEESATKHLESNS